MNSSCMIICHVHMHQEIDMKYIKSCVKQCIYTHGKQNRKHKYIRDVQKAYIMQLTYITHGNCTDDTIVGTTTCKKNMFQWKEINELTTCST